MREICKQVQVQAWGIVRTQVSGIAAIQVVQQSGAVQVNVQVNGEVYWPIHQNLKP